MNNVIRFKRFTKAQVLRKIGRELLARFFQSFADELSARGLELPSPSLADEDYYRSLARMMMSPEELPATLNEALYAIDEMASPEGQDRLEMAVEEAGIAPNLPPESSREDLALQVWFASPGLLARKHNEQRLLRLTAFQYFGASTAHGPPLPFPPPTSETLDQLTLGLDDWFYRHGRGQHTVRIELYPLNGEYWFLVRHGDSFSRTPKVESRKTEILHFRPERDDVVVYSPEHDEIRINTRTKGERDLYREQFGLCLRGARDYFSKRKTYTLEPLRADGPIALDTTGLDGIDKIVLREVEVAWDNYGHDVILRAADDVFRSAAAMENQDGPIPRTGRLTRAAFDLHFPDSARPRPVQIRPPNVLKVGRHCDAQRVDRWLCARGFRCGG